MSLPIPEFKILLYGPDLAPSGVRGRARFEAGRLVVLGGGRDISVAAERLSLQTGGFDGRQWLVTWLGASGRMTAMLQGSDAVDAFIRLAPKEVSAELLRTRRNLGREKRRFRFGMVLLAALLVLPLLLLGGFWLGADQMSQWAVEHVSPAQEKRLGDMAFEQMRPGLRLVESGPAQDALERVGLRLVGGEQRFRYEFHLALDDQANAFALPGGHVVVYSGLLKTMGCDDELAGVLAHEISHIHQRHSLRGMIRGLGWRAVLAVVLGHYGVGIWGDMATTLGDLEYSRDLEREADLGALQLLRRAGLPADGLPRFFERMASKEQAPPQMLSSHPASVERLAAIREAIARQPPYPNRSMDIDWPTLLAHLADLDVK
jgi:Zn-dependent protease with chaperone function